MNLYIQSNYNFISNSLKLSDILRVSIITDNEFIGKSNAIASSIKV